ncbi:branched-chain alpha-ketoacid dehydrogenase kinase [Limtongia smithiae]|uniref:branched-chain alpha-ketoacid dehydrogenase kinase n=1 Tax=Limtongia smithiae TaxID=1125753 RepID=UPI0034CE5708
MITVATLVGRNNILVTRAVQQSLLAAREFGRRHNSEVYNSTISSRHFYQNEALLNFSSRASRPISLKQFAFFGRKLTAEKIIQSANFVRQELPTRLAHRIHSMQVLPYSVVQNPHISRVYELYYQSFDALRKFPVIKTLEDNHRFCDLMHNMLTHHTTVIPHVIMGIIESADLMDYKKLDEFVHLLLSSRISRRVFTEQHIAMTDAFRKAPNSDISRDQVGQVFLQCNATDVVHRCDDLARKLVSSGHSHVELPALVLEGDVSTQFEFIESHLRYMIGEILRNAFEASVERFEINGSEPKPLLVTICNAPQHVIFRFSDTAGGIPSEIMHDLWSFAKGPRSMTRLRNFATVPALEAVIEELEAAVDANLRNRMRVSSLASLTTRSPDLRLGMGLPMSKVYAEFWGGRIAVNSLEGYGCDVVLHVSKLGVESRFLEAAHL